MENKISEQETIERASAALEETKKQFGFPTIVSTKFFRNPLNEKELVCILVSKLNDKLTINSDVVVVNNKEEETNAILKFTDNHANKLLEGFGDMLFENLYKTQ